MSRWRLALNAVDAIVSMLRNIAPLSPAFGIVTTVLVVSYLMAQEGAVQAWHPWTGLLQRGMAAAVMVWLFLLARRLFQTSGE